MVRLYDYSKEDDDLMIYDHSKTKRPRRSPPAIELGLQRPKSRMIDRHGNIDEEVFFQDGRDFALEKISGGVRDVGGLEGGAVGLVNDPIKKTFRKRPSFSPVEISGGVRDVGGLEGRAVDLVYDPIKKTFRKRPTVSPVRTSGGVRDVGGLEGCAVDLVYDPIKKTFRKRPSVSPVQTRDFSITSNNEVGGAHDEEGGAHDEEGGAGDEHGGDAKDIRLLVNRAIPSGFHFFPSDAELVQFLTVKIEDPSFQFLCIPDIEVYKLHPEEICQGSIKICFTKVERQGGRDKKRVARSAGEFGSWILSGTTTDVQRKGVTVGIKRALTFILAKDKKSKNSSGYQMKEVSKLDESIDWVVCTIYHKDHHNEDADGDDILVFDPAHVL